MSLHPSSTARITPQSLPRVGVDGMFALSTVRNAREANRRFVGRQYKRTQKAYVDVLSMPDICEAIDCASKMLRIGLMKAMHASQVDGQGNLIESSKASRASATRSKPTQQSRTLSDSHALYSMLGERSDKRKKERVAALREARVREAAVSSAPLAKDNTEDELPSAQKPTATQSASHQQPKSRLISRSWNSSTKAGPSILSKRARSEAEAADAAKAAPASAKRARVQSDLSRTPSAKPARNTQSKRISIDSDPSQAKADGPPTTVSNAKASDVTSAATKAQSRAKKAVDPRDGKPSALNRVANMPPKMTKVSAAPAKTNVLPISNATSKFNQGSRNLSKSSVFPRANLAKSGTKSAPGVSRSSAARARILGKTPTTSKLISKTSVKPTTKSSKPSTPKASKPLHNLAPMSRSSSLTSAARSAVSNSLLSTSASTSHAIPVVPRQKTVPFPHLRMPRPNSAAPNSILPVVPGLVRRGSAPNSAVRTTGVLIPEGLKPLGTVPANGYKIMDSGPKPVVTMDPMPNPKVPYKLRQTSADKMFEAWRDYKKLPVMEALVKALRSEQATYAQAAGRADYRSAVQSMLKDAKQA